MMRPGNGFNAEPSQANKASLNVLAGLINGIFSEVIYEQIKDDLIAEGVLEANESNREDVLYNYIYGR